MIDLSEEEIIDVHAHRPERKTLTEAYEMWTPRFVDSMLPPYDFDKKAELKAKLSEIFREQMQFGSPRVVGLLNYAAKVYGCEASVEAFDAVLAEKMQGSFREYLKSVLDREQISHLVLDQSRLVERPVAAIGDLPQDRTKWTFNIIPLLQPEWAEKNGARSLGGVTDLLDELVREAVQNGCAGLKNSMAYFRRLSLTVVSEDQGDQAFAWLLANKSGGERPVSHPAAIDEAAKRSSELQVYQDYVLRTLYSMAGRSSLVVHVHVASALNPALNPVNNDPTGLYSVVNDEQIRAAGTEFLILHTGFPLHNQVATLISQYPNVYADLSFFSQFPGILEEVLRTFLQLAPPHKLMHGSDSNLVAEVMAYSAHNTKKVLSKVLNDFVNDYGWTEEQCMNVARLVLSANAKRLFKIQ